MLQPISGVSQGINAVSQGRVGALPSVLDAREFNHTEINCLARLSISPSGGIAPVVGYVVYAHRIRVPYACSWRLRHLVAEVEVPLSVGPRLGHGDGSAEGRRDRDDGDAEVLDGLAGAFEHDGAEGADGGVLLALEQIAAGQQEQ